MIDRRGRLSFLGRRDRAAGGAAFPRIATAVYLAAFLFTSDAAPHRHRDGAADLLDGHPSDSGVVLETSAAPGTDAVLATARLVDDDPCAACFSSDFAAGVGPAVVPMTTPGARPAGRVSIAATPGAAAFRPASSRSPPPRGA